MRPRRCGAVRPATAADLDDVARIEHEQFSNPWTREYYAAELHNARSHFFVITCAAPDGLGDPAEMVVGYLLFWRLGDELELHKIAVAAAWQRLGHATRLMEAFVSAGRCWECERAVLEVRASNQAAIRLYEKFGFQAVGRRRDYYHHPGEDAQIFALRF